MKKLFYFFDKLEDVIRRALSKTPPLYALIGGISVVLFWRGVWHLADEYGMSAWASFIVSVVIMLATGTFVSFFIGEQILISGLKAEKRIDQRTEDDIEREEQRLAVLAQEIRDIRKDVQYIKENLPHQPKKTSTKKPLA